MFHKQHHQPQPLLTAEQIEVRIWGFVVVVVTLVLAGIVGFMLYSLAYVQQPIKTMAPMDIAFSKMLNDIVLLIVGGIGGVMSKKGVQAVSENMAARQVPVSPTPAPATAVANPLGAYPSVPGFNWLGFKNPDLDEEWRAPPPPTTPPDHLDPSREDIASERAAAKLESE